MITKLYYSFGDGFLGFSKIHEGSSSVIKHRSAIRLKKNKALFNKESRFTILPSSKLSTQIKVIIWIYVIAE